MLFVLLFSGSRGISILSDSGRCSDARAAHPCRFAIGLNWMDIIHESPGKIQHKIESTKLYMAHIYVSSNSKPSLEGLVS